MKRSNKKLHCSTSNLVTKYKLLHNTFVKLVSNDKFKLFKYWVVRQQKILKATAVRQVRYR